MNCREFGHIDKPLCCYPFRLMSDNTLFLRETCGAASHLESGCEDLVSRSLHSFQTSWSCLSLGRAVSSGPPLSVVTAFPETARMKLTP